ncbi:MAG: hypothetical protein H6518_12385 [Microthrixaceae bacterium]|nr:hypothetical protein [Microthrixaceae bacterium]
MTTIQPLGGLAGDIERRWSTLVARAEKALTAAKSSGVRAAVEAVTVPADTLSVAPWRGPSWLPLSPPPTGEQRRVAAGVPLVRLAVTTEPQASVEELEQGIDDLVERAGIALDRMALLGVPTDPIDESAAPDSSPLAHAARALYLWATRSSAGGTGRGHFVPPIVEDERRSDLPAALARLGSPGAVVLHRKVRLSKSEQEKITEVLGTAKPVRCPGLDQPFLLLVPDRVQLVVSQEWALSYLLDRADAARLELSMIGVFRARADAAIAFG